MIDSEFDDFTKGRLGDHEVPVPAGLWDKIADAQFDQFFGHTLKDKEAPVPGSLWDKITDTQFDNFFGNTLATAAAPVPEGVWDKISDGQFDSFVSGKLSGYESAVPAGLWDKIMPKDNGRKGGYILFRSAGRAVAALLLLVGLLGGGYYWYTISDKNNTALTPELSSIPAKTSVDPKADNNTNSNTIVTVPSEATNTGNTPVNKDAKKTDAANLPAQSSDNRLQTEDNTINASSSSAVSSSARKTNRAGVPVASGITGNGQKNTAIIPSANNTIVQSNNTNGLLAEPSKETTNDFGFIEPYQTNHLTASTIPFNNSMGAGMINKQLSPNHANRHKSIIICPADKGRNTDWYLEGYLSPDLAFSSITNNTASQQFLARKDSSESMNIGFTAGIRLAKPITDNILVKTGLQFTQMNQKYVYRTENEIKTTTVVSQRTIIRAPGDTLIIMDTSVVQQTGFKNNTVINRFRSLDIPVLVGYQFGTKDDDLRIGINAGVIVNVSSWYQGVMLDSALATVPIAKGSSNMVYKDKVGLALYGGISIVKKLSDDMQVFAEPYFRYNLSNTTTPNAAYNQKFSVGGISLGVRLNLNRQ